MGGYTGEWIEKWHEDYQPDPHPQVGDIYSGLRAPVGTRAKDVTSPCQYWIKGMPAVCSKFVDGKCVVEKDSNGKYPTGYNNEYCDYLGRRNWCNQYEGGTENLDEYICIAPDIFRTGLGKRNTDITTHLELIPYPVEEILGYNPDDETGVGQCDGLGMGRGAGGEDITDPEQMYKLPVVCRHYKPWIMGFGAIKPRPLGTAILEGRDIYDGSEADPLTPMTRYLPFAFRMLNMRAHYQKCSYWAQDYGTDFEMDYSGGYATIELPEDPLTECTCTDSACIPYKTIISTWPEHSSDTLVDVLTEEGNFICNGAHSECPCYTGKWVYCVADNMRDGMRITAEQILELRFWLAVWQTKEIYDAIFAEKSGPLDITTSDIFTFDKWEKLGADVNESVMKGKRIYQCFPIPLHERVFDPEVYLTKENITYPKADAITGTADSKTSSFPTLVRKIDSGVLVPPLDVIYPYTCKDPWNAVPCVSEATGDLMEVASCKMEPSATAVFGYTVRDKEVYALNVNKLSLCESVNFEQFKITMVSLLPEEERKIINAAIKNLIKTSMESGADHNYIVSGISNEYGYFGIGPLSLEYNTTTTIAVICKWSATEYEVVIRKVKSQFYGGAIVQDNFELKYEKSGHFVTLPGSFTPPAKLSGRVQTFGGSTHSIFPVYSSYNYGIMQDTVCYSYCVNEYTKEDTVTKWVRIGPTGYIWAFLDNIDVSYLFDFEVTKAYIVYVGEKITACGESGSNIELEIIYPKTGDPDIIKRKHILPNCVLLKSPKPHGFFNEDWTLHVEYKYKVLESSKPDKEDTDVETVWPTDLDGEGSSNKFVEVPFSLDASDNEFKVENIRTGTIALMVYIEDEDGRVQAATATKMLLDVVTTRCRPVEIFYAYIADAVGYDLIPNSGFFTWVGGDKVLDGDYKHYNRPKCGDHDCNPDNCIGPMWYPFNNCTTIDFYSWYSGAATCARPIEGQGGPLAPTPRHDWRYCMAHDYKAWVRTGANWAAACGNGWYYSYSKAGESMFSGYGKIRTSVYLNEYSFKGWTPPPFGNDGREITERWLSQEHYGFWDLSGTKPTPKREYMPLVFDDEMLFTSFDAFEEQGRIGPISDYFHTTCMLNYMLFDDIGETMNEDRYRFEDLFEVRNHAWCMYPPPVYEGPGGSVTARRYNFKIEDVAWAWREYWKDVERAVATDHEVEMGLSSSSPILNFIDPTNKPPYYFDSEKKEHRLITDEGNVGINFIAPKKDEENPGGFTYPEIGIEGGPLRKFKIIYDDYDDVQVEWMDEGGDGTEESSGGEEEKSIYEEAMGDDWVHDDNTIFDANASAEKSDDRKIVIGDENKWYNRGLIANIPKNRLIYLPYELEDEPIKEPNISINRPPDAQTEYFMVWYNDSKRKDDIIFTVGGFDCIVELSISGKIGAKKKSDYYFKAGIYCRPEITISECGVDDDPLAEFPASTVLFEDAGEKGDKTPEKGEYYKYLEFYDFEIELNRSPKRMLFSSPCFQVKCTLFPEQHLMLRRIYDGGLYLWPGHYTDAIETIKVWEQRYITSTGEFGDKNPDGPESFELRSYERNLKNAGQYFPTGIHSPNQDSIEMFDKMTMVGAGKQYQEDEALNISKGNLKAIEAEEQQKLYEDAYNRDVHDELTYNIIVPPNVQQFFDANNISSHGFGGNCVFVSEKLPWDKHVNTISFDQDFDFWSPGGHYFVWDYKYYKTKCYIFGPVETIYSPKVVHYKHGGADMIWTPLQTYVGWAKLEYYTWKQIQESLTGKVIDTGYDWVGLSAGAIIEPY